MFVCSFRISKLKVLFSAALVAAVAAFAIILMPDTADSVSVNGIQHESEIKFDGIRSVEDAAGFAESLGYKIDKESAELVHVALPAKFDAVLDKYNKLQKSQGFNLSKYKNKAVDRYTYTVTALPDGKAVSPGEALLTLITYKDKIVGGDLYFPGGNGEVKTIF